MYLFHIYIYTYMYIYIYLNKYMYICIYSTYIYIHICIYVYIQINICIYVSIPHWYQLILATLLPHYYHISSLPLTVLPLYSHITTTLLLLYYDRPVNQIGVLHRGVDLHQNIEIISRRAFDANRPSAFRAPAAKKQNQGRKTKQ